MFEKMQNVLFGRLVLYKSTKQFAYYIENKILQIIKTSEFFFLIKNILKMLKTDNSKISFFFMIIDIIKFLIFVLDLIHHYVI